MPSDILIQPNRGSTTLNPVIFFSGSAANNSIRLETLPSGSVAFLGNSGSLFSIVDSMSGSLMAVSDVSGLPILEVFSDDRVVMGKFNSNTLVVTGSNVSIGKTAPNAKLDVNGNAVVTGSLGVTSTSDSAIISRGGALFGPNTTWSKYLLVGGDGRQNYTDNTSVASVCTTNGNLHIDAASTFETYINWYDGAQFRIGGGDSSTTRLIVNSSGNVGIGGTTTPNGKLDVNGNVVVTGSLTATSTIKMANDLWHTSIDTRNRFYFATNGTTYFGTYNGYEWRDSTNGTLMYHDGSNFSIGKSTNGINAKLDVNGNTIITGSLTVTGTITGTLGSTQDPDFTPVFMLMGA